MDDDDKIEEEEEEEEEEDDDDEEEEVEAEEAEEDDGDGSKCMSSRNTLCKLSVPSAEDVSEPSRTSVLDKDERIFFVCQVSTCYENQTTRQEIW